MKKNYGGLIRLFVLLVILPLAAWCLGVGPTIGQWRKYRAEQSEIRLLEAGGDRPESSPKLQEDLLNNGDLLKTVFPRIEKNGIHVDLYVPYRTETRGAITLRSAEVVLRGEYSSLLKVISALEHDVPQISLRSVEFASVNNLHEKKLQLRVSLIVQQLTHTEP